MTGTVDLHVRLLGPVEVVRGDGRVVPLTASKERALLALLALHDGHGAPAGVLIDGLWGSDPPARAGNALQVYVSHLRRLLGKDAVRTEPPGYRLAVGSGHVDIERFERMAKSGRQALADGLPDRAADLLGAALGLWRGAALGGCGDTGLLAREAARLEELRLAALEDRLSAQLQLAPDGAFVEEVRRLVTANPFRERMHELLVRALYATGRRAEALVAFADARRLLADELGIEPGPSLRALHSAVLRDDASLAPPPAPDRNLPIDRPPAARTTLVGRGLEVREVAALLADDDVRLVSLLGPGGVGKTRLSLAAADLAAAGFADGVCWVPLGALRDARHVPVAMAAALGLGNDRGEDDAIARVASVLRRRELLLLVDNIEHLLPDAGRVLAHLLGEVPRLTVLVTSRVALRIAGEHRYRVPTLPVSTAGVLFVQRARAVDPAFVPDDPADRVVAKICTRLDGLPLAIELAASRSNLFTPSELLGRLTDTLSLSGAPTLDSADRHRSLRVALDWSHDLLDAPARQLFAQLSVFRAGFTVESAAAVADSDADAVADRLDELLEASLVTPTPPVGGGVGQHRFFMLETVRAYASEQLTDPAPARDRHAQFFSSLVSGLWRSQPPLWPPPTYAHATALDIEQENIRAAVAHTAATEQHTMLADLVTHVAGFWSQSGMGAELGGWLDAVMAAPVAAPRLMDATFWAADLAEGRGDLTTARALALPLTEPGGDAVRESRAWLQVAWCHMREGNIETAISHAETALTLVSHTEDPNAVACARMHLAVFLQATAPERSLAMLREGVRLARSSGNEMALAAATINLAETLLGIGDAAGAVAAAREALDQPLAERATNLRAGVQDTLGAALLLAGDLDGAQQSLTEALRVAQWSGDVLLVVELAARFAALAAVRGELRRAAALQSAHAVMMRRFGLVLIKSDRYLAHHILDPAVERLDTEAAAAAELGAALTLDELPVVLLEPSWPGP